MAREHARPTAGEAADWQSAIRQVYNLRYEGPKSKNTKWGEKRPNCGLKTTFLASGRRAAVLMGKAREHARPTMGEAAGRRPVGDPRAYATDEGGRSEPSWTFAW